MYFKQYIKGLNGPSLRKLVQFLTWSDVVAVEKIHIVHYKPENEFCRRPISHTCGAGLELPTTNNNFCELREELNKILQRNSREFDIA